MKSQRSEDQGHDYTEVYAWGSKSDLTTLADDTFGQLGISSQGTGKNYGRPKFCSFNIIIKDLSCGDDHTALVTSKELNAYRNRRRVRIHDGQQFEWKTGIGRSSPPAQHCSMLGGNPFVTTHLQGVLRLHSHRSHHR